MIQQRYQVFNYAFANFQAMNNYAVIDAKHLVLRFVFDSYTTGGLLHNIDLEFYAEQIAPIRWLYRMSRIW